jgi:hypothetical protein
MIRGLRGAAVVALTFIPALASAQITTVISAPKRQQATAQVAAQREAATQDSIARVTLTGMKEWVDSAANAMAVRPDTGVTVADTALASTTQPPRQRADSTPTRPSTARPADAFRDGARAPNTATPWPTLAALGLGLIGVGLLIRRRLTPLRSGSRRG